MSDAVINQARASIYQLMSSLFAKEINQDSLATLNSPQGKSFWGQLSQEEQLKTDVDTLVARLDELTSEKELLELAADYCGLFLVGTKNSASPYASIYIAAKKADDNPKPENSNGSESKNTSGNKKRNKEHEVAIFGEQHQKMVAFLQQSKLEISSEFPEPADHIAVILAYLANLCQNNHYSEQLQFINDNILDWISHFVAQVERNDPGNFYSALARLTQSWLILDQQWLNEEI